MNTAIELTHVSAGYRDNPVLHDITLSIAAGEMVGVLGPNGAGKTTLFRVLTGLCAPSSGTVRIFGQDIRRMPAQERARQIGVVPQEVDTPVAFTVEEIVMLGRSAALRRWARPGALDHEIVDRAMVYTNVADLRHRPFAHLSGGEKQRVIVAMALAQEPRLILMDEATSHLDVNHRFELMQIIERLNGEQGVSVVIISHDLNLAADFCRRLVLLDHGRIAADGRPAQVLTDEMLHRVYHCDLHVQQDAESGSLNIVSVRRPAANRHGQGHRL